MLECRKRQIEKSGGEIIHRCVNKKADDYLQVVEESICESCPVRAYLETSKKPKQAPVLPIVDTSGFPSCEFRYKQEGQPQCGVTGLSVDKEICKRCAKDEKMATPRLLEKVMNYSAAVRRWVAAGKPERTDDEIKEIYENHCSQCSMYDKERKICNSCGCPANTNQPALRNKLRMATEACPLGRFPAKVETNA